MLAVRTVFYFWGMPDSAIRSKASHPIGFFDSGVGGISIWKEVHRFLPREHTIYLADSHNAPYGPRGKEGVLKLARKNTELLLDRQCKLIVVACNTATTMAIAELRKTFKVPFIGIEPAIKPAALATKSGKVGVLATRGTLASELFQSTSSLHAAGITVLEQEGTGLVEQIEQARHLGPEMGDYLKEILQPMIVEGIDHLVLGCTHYAFLTPVLQDILPKKVKILDCSWPVARQTAAILMRHGLENVSEKWGTHEFYTNGEVEILKTFLSDQDPGIMAEYLNF